MVDKIFELKRAEQMDCRNRTERYDLTFVWEDIEFQTQTWVKDDNKVVTFEGPMPDIESASKIEERVEDIVEFSEEFEWYFPLLKRTVSLTKSIIENWDEYTRKEAILSAIQDTVDDRDYHSDIDYDEFSPQFVEYALKKAFEGELE